MNPALDPKHQPRVGTRVRQLAFAITLAATISYVGNPVLAAEPIEGGFEIHRQGTSPHIRDAAKRQVEATQAQCAQAAELCAMLGSSQGAAKGDECLARMSPEPFAIVGDPDSVGDYRIVEYHHPGLRKSSVTKRSYELVPTAVCRLEVLARETTIITHFHARNREVFTRELNPRRGVQPWRSKTLPPVDSNAFDLTRQALSLQSLEPIELGGGTHTIASAPGLAEARIADRQCRWITLSPPPMGGRLCMLTEGIGMPINESLSAELIGDGVDGPVVMLRDEVVLFSGPIALPQSHFEPNPQ